MLDLAKHIVEQKSGHFEPAKFEDHYEAALTELINKKRNGERIQSVSAPRGDNVVNLMDALKRSLSNAPKAAAPALPAKKPLKAKKTSGSQREMLLPISGEKSGRAAKAKVSRAASNRKAG